jgi:hypothetical protein
MCRASVKQVEVEVDPLPEGEGELVQDGRDIRHPKRPNSLRDPLALRERGRGEGLATE